MIGVGRCDHLRECRKFDLLPRIVAWRPTVEVDNITRDCGSRLRLAGEPANEPQSLTIDDRISSELIGTGRDDLCGTAGRPMNDWRGVPVTHLTRRLPGDLAGARVHSEDEGVG